LKPLGSKEVKMQEFKLTGMVDEQGNIRLDQPLNHCKHKRVQAILLISDDNLESMEENDWKYLSTEQFLHGYSDADAIYDED
jgi:hypothetical protein